jgi:type I restriction enzyme S subunit
MFEYEIKSIDEIYDLSIRKTPPKKESKGFSNNKNDVKWISIKDLGKS